MIRHSCFALLLSFAALALAGSDGDAVNERIPVDKKELEDHWQVNCTNAWTRLRASAARQPTKDNCEISTEMVREIKLCTFIYQPPGENSRHKCPDYRSVAQQLALSGATEDCPSLSPSSANQLDCGGASGPVPDHAGTGGDSIP